MALSLEPASNFKSNVLIDGIYVLSNVWSIWNPIKSPSIKLPFLVQKERVKKAVKGSKYLKDIQYVYLVRLFEVCDMFVNLAFYSVDENISYSRLIFIATQCLENALNRESYSESYARKRQKVDQCKMARLVSLRDFHKLGHTFTCELNKMTVNSSIRFVFLSSSSGQSQFLDYFASNTLKLTREEDVIEAIYHVAIDTVQDSRYLLWSREGLDTYLPKPSQEYFPNCLGNFGNFYYDVNVPLCSSNMQISQLKLYTKCHSYCHDNPRPPFQEPSASVLFLNAATLGFQFKKKAAIKKIETDCQRVRKEIDLLKRIIEDFDIQSSGVARLEAICCCSNLTNIIEAANRCVDLIKNSNLISSNNLYAIPGELLKFRCEAIFLPYIKLVETRLVTLCDMLKPEPNLVYLNITTDEIITVEAGEAAIAFMLYGRSAITCVSRGHNYQLCKQLGLVASQYKFSYEVFPTFCKNFHLDSDNKLEYVPSFNYLPLMNEKGFKKYIDLSKIFELTAGFHDTDNILLLCKYILVKICQCINASYGKYDRSVPTISKTSVLIGKLPRNVIISSHTFSRLFFSLNNDYFMLVPGVVWLRTLLFQCLNPVEKSLLVTHFGKTIERELYNRECCFFFSIKPETILIVNPIGYNYRVKDTVFLWSRALILVLKDIERIKTPNLEMLSRAIHVMTLKNVENYDLNRILIEVNDRDDLTHDKVKIIFETHHTDIYE